jgi:poly(3-hydroxybutyrate) depolymerase
VATAVAPPAPRAPWDDPHRVPGCPATIAAEQYTVAGAVHEWQGGDSGDGGPRGQAIDATSVIWSFFAHHHLP